MNKLHETLGLTDGAGSVSSQRVISFLIVAAWVVTSAYSAFKAGTPMQISGADVGLLGTIIGGGVLKNAAENTNINIGQPKTP